MKKLIDIVNRKPVPKPWEEGDNIPWNDPEFSKRMLNEHLSQDHNAASRKFPMIDRHVDWIHKQVFSQKIKKILDLACGPGLYANRLAKLGHQCVGIDYSPASIAFAKNTATEDGVNCVFQEADIRKTNYGKGFDAAMLIYGELNVFKPADASLILSKIHQALKPGALMILEPITFDAVHKWGKRSPSWNTSNTGLFAKDPHFVMEEFFWDTAKKVTTNRYYVISAVNSAVSLYAQSVQAYTQAEYISLLEKYGYTNIKLYPSLTGEPDPEQEDLLAIVATRS